MRTLVFALCVCAGTAAELDRDLLDTERPRYWRDNRRYSLVPWVDPLRGVISQGGNPHDIVLQDKIVREVYSPVYYQPTLVVDYRYLKTGRAYTRGLGGQVLILPYGAKESGSGQSYDRLLDNLKEEEHRELPEGDLPYGRREEPIEPMWVPEVPQRARELGIVRDLERNRKLEREVHRNWKKMPVWKAVIPTRAELYGK